ncbi:WXG100 family type VII secretion target [Streptacidiphilus sp. P02-A3a]|uniref:WXG100 family type VII secretion target n=1 Tax=Streptacidiphilus sp. P02-A3a TaxID=2704468 RepID=UPI0015F8BDB5|nr:hypothetical protein [Streptacidiphilus sp. P02-A3a]QMU72476.1 hypothetical protein GXP74_33755 [Streptacidiphilus sp. P02-A3a]
MRSNDGYGGADITVDIPPGDPAALHRLADTLDSYAAAVGTLGDNTLSTTAGIRSKAAWSGTAADAYSAFTGTTSGSIKDLQPHLSTIASSVRSYATTLDAAQKQIEAILDTANKTATPQSQLATAQQAAAQAQHDVDAAGAKASGEVDDAKSSMEKFFDAIEPYRKANEWIHLPVDLATDPLTEKLLKSLGTGLDLARESVKELKTQLSDEFTEQVGSVAHDFDHGEASMEDIDAAMARYQTVADGIEDGLADAKSVLGRWRVGNDSFGGAAILGDALTMADPEDKGTMGDVDRSAAGVNAAAAGSSLIYELATANSLDEVPGIGEVVMVADAGTGIYLAGDFLYHNVKPFHDACDFVGSGVATAAKSTAHGVSEAAHSVAHFFDHL